MKLLKAILLLIFAGLAGGASAVAEEHPLPGPAVLSLVAPQADSFGEFTGTPPAAPAYAKGELVGYVFTTWMVVRSTGYSAKPLDVLVGLNLEGIITGAEILEQHEPLLIIGIDGHELAAFVAQFRGRDIRSPFLITGGAAKPEGTVDAVTGATISSLVINDAILRSARRVAKSRGILGAAGSRFDFEAYEPADWMALVAEGSITTHQITVGEASEAIEARDGRLFAPGVPQPDPEAAFIKVYLGLATPVRVSRNLLGDRDYNAVFAGLSAGDQLLFIAAEGLYSFKGRHYRQTGVFDRIRLIQGERSFTFRFDDYLGRETLQIDGAPSLREIGFFVLAGEAGFDPGRPFQLQLRVVGQPQDGNQAAATFEFAYQLPERYIRLQEDALAPGDSTALWQQHWRHRGRDIGILAAGLTILSLVLFFQDALARRKKLYLILRIGFLIFTLIWIGWVMGAQLSVLNVLTFADSLVHEFRWDFFLLEPLIFILWGYTAVALMFWGRGVFCGWLCPFGALQELAARLARLAHLPQWRLPFPLHERLWPIKYVAFIALFALFLYDPALAITGAEIEPFKTAIVLKFDRSWPFLLYVALILLAGLFVTRVYCRYLCPLGAALALPARLRMFEWLRRHWQCGKPCQQCALSCPVQAIHPEGKINPNECIHCLNCQVNYYDDSFCPLLVERKRRRERSRRKAAET